MARNMMFYIQENLAERLRLETNMSSLINSLLEQYYQKDIKEEYEEKRAQLKKDQEEIDKISKEIKALDAKKRKILLDSAGIEKKNHLENIKYKLRNLWIDQLNETLLEEEADQLAKRIDKKEISITTIIQNELAKRKSKQKAKKLDQP